MGSTRSLRRAPAVGVLVLVAAALSACTGPEDGLAGQDEGSGLVAAGLAELPPPEDPGSLMVTVADVAAASEANGLERPGSPDAAFPDWVTDMTGGRDAVVMVVPPALVAVAEPAAVAEETGFWWGQADRLASVSAPPDDFTVLAGGVDDVEFPSGVDETGDGLWTVGDGEDGEVDPEGATAVDRLGRPVRLARGEDRLAMSLSTPMVQAWADGEGDTLADDESLAAVATALDDADVVSAVLARLSGPEPAGVGVGWAAGDQPTVTIAYDYGTDQAAQDAGEEAERAYTDGTSLATNQPYADLVDLEEVEVSGRVVVVTVGVPRERVSTPYDMLVRQDLPLLENPLRPSAPSS